MFVSLSVHEQGSSRAHEGAKEEKEEKGSNTDPAAEALFSASAKSSSTALEVESDPAETEVATQLDSTDSEQLKLLEAFSAPKHADLLQNLPSSTSVSIPLMTVPAVPPPPPSATPSPTSLNVEASKTEPTKPAESKSD